MAYNPNDVQSLLGPYMAAFAATGQVQPQARQVSPSTDALSNQLARLESRMERMESTLNNILDRLEPLKTDSDSGSKPTETSIPTVARSKPSSPIGAPLLAESRKYVYDPLDSIKSQCRILKVLRAKDVSEPLVAELITVSLDDNTHAQLLWGFTALSYTWGPAVFDGSILLDGCQFPITQSLEAALRQLRFEYENNTSIEINGIDWRKELCIWVDQICINQADIDERGDQVSLMRRIYKSATSVHVWLGQEADDSALAIDLLNILGAPPKHAPGGKGIKYPSFTEEQVMRHWNALRAFFKRPWWERVWIRQEVALAHTITVQCGPKSFDMRHLEPALFMLTNVASLGYANTYAQSDSELAVVLPWDFHARLLVELRKFTGLGNFWVDLAQLLRMMRSCKATDPRDTVFSVLGLADTDVYGLEPNYRQDLQHVLFGTVRAAIGVKYGLDILGVCQNPERRLGMPSWMPNMTEKWKALPFKTSSTEITVERRMPCLTKSEMPNARLEDQELWIQGQLVDSVKSICSTYVRQNSGVEALDSVFATWKDYARSVSARQLWTKEPFESFVATTDIEGRDWVRFLTALADDAQDVDAIYGQAPRGAMRPGDPDAFLNHPLYRHMELNPRLSRCHLLPLSHGEKGPHPNYKAHAGLQSYGVGRRFGVTSRGFLVLLPAEARIGDPIALFKGASFPYVLRRSKDGSNHVLVGEAFIPAWLGSITFGIESKGAAEELLRADLRDWIRLC